MLQRISEGYFQSILTFRLLLSPRIHMIAAILQLVIGQHGGYLRLRYVFFGPSKSHTRNACMITSSSPEHALKQDFHA